MGYVSDTNVAQYIPPSLFHTTAVGTWTIAVGQVAGTEALHRAAASQTAVLYIPIVVPSNSVALKGALLKSIEVDYENVAASMTTITPVLEKVTRGAEGAVAVVSTVTTTFTPAAGTLLTQTQHKLVVTLTTPEWVNQNTYYLLQLTLVAPVTVTNDFLGAVANYTLRV